MFFALIFVVTRHKKTVTNYLLLQMFSNVHSLIDRGRALQCIVVVV